MRVLFVTEKSYPHDVSAVSHWANDLITGLPEYQFVVFSLSMGPLVRPRQTTFARPLNLERLIRIQLGVPRPHVREASAEERERFHQALGSLLLFLNHDLPRFAKGLHDLALLGQEINVWPLFDERHVWQRVQSLLQPSLPYTPSLAEIALCLGWLRQNLTPLLRVPPKTDLIHTTVNSLGAVPAWLASQLHGVPLLLTEHHSALRERYLKESKTDVPALKRFQTRFYELLARLIYWQADRIVAVSEFNRAWQLRFAAPRERTQVIPNGVALSIPPPESLATKGKGTIKTKATKSAQATKPAKATQLVEDLKSSSLHNSLHNKDIELVTAPEPWETSEVVLEDSDLEEDLESEETQPTLVWFGCIEPLKDLETLLAALWQVKQQQPEVRLKLFGPVTQPRYQTHLQKNIIKLGLGASVSFEGSAPSSEAFAGADIVVSSSKSEGFPLRVLEAMALGKAVVATRVSSVHELLQDAGRTVPAQSPTALAGALIDLLEHPEERLKLGRRAKARAKLFSLDTMLLRYGELYDDLIRPVRPRDLPVFNNGQFSEFSDGQFSDRQRNLFNTDIHVIIDYANRANDYRPKLKPKARPTLYPKDIYTSHHDGTRHNGNQHNGTQHNGNQT
ncbi:MAG: DUF3492 domain-containing protein [Trueperaceae bacterium]